MALKEGAPLLSGNSELLNGPLGNCLIGFDGYMLGLTNADTNIKSDDDVKEIMYSQEGTKAADHVITGQLGMLEATFAEIKTSLLTKLKHGFTSMAVPGTGDDSATFGRYIYQSLRDNKAKALRVYATDANGVPLLDEFSVMNAYLAVPIINDNLINWGADTQRGLQVSFMIYYKKFGIDQVVGGPVGAFAYYGAPAQEKLPATTWPDVAAPQLLTAVATSATSVTLTFNENIAEQVGADFESIVIKVNGVNILASAFGAITTVEAIVTFPAVSIASGDTVFISISDTVYEDTETVANAFEGVSDFLVTNSVP